MKNLAKHILFSSLLTLGISNVTNADNKVLLIGVDGVQYEKLSTVNTPNFDRLHIQKAWTGGITGDITEQGTFSGPGWSTIHTGVWANKHQITENGDTSSNPQYPSIFKRVRDAKPNAFIASIAHWGNPNTHFFPNDVAGNDVTLSGIADQAVTDKVVELINTTSADFIFAHLDDPDHHGHSSCFGSAYNNSIETADRQIGEMMAAIDSKVATTGDNWLILITTDHGRDSRGCGHGSQTTEEKTIFIASNQALNSEFTTPVSNIENTDFGGLYGYPSQASLTPTALRHLGIEPQISWQLDGIPLNGALAVQKMMPASSSDIAWHSNSATTVDIYRNGNFVETINSLEKSWSDTNSSNGINDYVLVQNQTPAAIQLNKLDINAALSWNSIRSYMFRSNETYVRYSKTLDRADSGYPKATSEDLWPGLGQYANKVVAALEKNTSVSYFFLNDGTYIRYNNILDRADAGYPKPVNDSTWPGLGGYGDKIIATLRWSNDKAYFFLNDGRYIRYDIGDDKADSGYPQPIDDNTWPGLGAYAQDITSAFKWNNSRAYFFLTGQRYIRYSISDDRVDNGYPAKTNNNTWPGLL